MVSYGDNNCRIKYMFDNMEEAVEQETTIEEEDEENQRMEIRKRTHEDVHDYEDNGVLKFEWDIVHYEVKEVYKEYIGMVKIYYEEAKRSRHGEPGDVAVNCRGTAGKERPQADARIDAEVEEMLDETPRKRSKTEKEDVELEEVNSGASMKQQYQEKEQAQVAVMILSSSLKVRTKKHVKNGIKALGGTCEPVNACNA
ncbi:hypothetical protein Tco_0983411 [Tanacetum coccineum]